MNIFLFDDDFTSFDAQAFHLFLSDKFTSEELIDLSKVVSDMQK